MNGNFGLSINVSFTLSFDLGKKSTRFSFFVISFASIIDIQLQIIGRSGVRLHNFTFFSISVLDLMIKSFSLCLPVNTLVIVSKIETHPYLFPSFVSFPFLFISYHFPQHFLYFNPLPHGHISFRPIFKPFFLNSAIRKALNLSNCISISESHSHFLL